jgi:hypothetical protein
MHAICTHQERPVHDMSAETTCLAFVSPGCTRAVNTTPRLAFKASESVAAVGQQKVSQTIRVWKENAGMRKDVLVDVIVITSQTFPARVRQSGRLRKRAARLGSFSSALRNLQQERR